MCALTEPFGSHSGTSVDRCPLGIHLPLSSYWSRAHLFPAKKICCIRPRSHKPPLRANAQLPFFRRICINIIWSKPEKEFNHNTVLASIFCFPSAIRDYFQSRDGPPTASSQSWMVKWLKSLASTKTLFGLSSQCSAAPRAANLADNILTRKFGRKRSWFDSGPGLLAIHTLFKTCFSTFCILVSFPSLICGNRRKIMAICRSEVLPWEMQWNLNLALTCALARVATSGYSTLLADPQNMPKVLFKVLWHCMAPTRNYSPSNQGSPLLSAELRIWDKRPKALTSWQWQPVRAKALKWIIPW